MSVTKQLIHPIELHSFVSLAIMGRLIKKESKQHITALSRQNQNLKLLENMMTVLPWGN